MKDEVIKIFCEIDDFCIRFDREIGEHLLGDGKRLPTREPGLCISEMMTIMVHFHQRGFRNFKTYYQDYVCVHLKDDFPRLVSYNRFVALTGRMLVHLTLFQVTTQTGEVTGFSFIDSTTLHVCRNQRIFQHKVFDGFARRGKTSMGWFFGFKLHLVVNDRGEILSWCLSTGNVSDQDLGVCDFLTRNLWGKLVGDKGYISQKLFDMLFGKGIQLITKIKKNMKNRLVQMDDKLLLRKRWIIETINDQLKNISQIEHTRHRSPLNFLVNLVAGLIAYGYQEKKPSLIRNVDKSGSLSAA
jgi:hypothetical protein